MRCPYCGAKGARVTSSISKDAAPGIIKKSELEKLNAEGDFVIRKRICLNCFEGVMTIERYFKYES